MKKSMLEHVRPVRRHFSSALLASLVLAGCSGLRDDVASTSAPEAPARAGAAPSLGAQGSASPTAAPTGEPTTSPTTTTSPTPAPPLTLLAPGNDPYAWERGSRHVVVWNDTRDPEGKAPVEVAYSIDAGAKWVVLDATDVDPTYKRAWLDAPAVGGADVMVKVTTGGLTVTSKRYSLAPSQKRDYTYQELTHDAPFGGRDGMGGVVYNGRLYGIGGWNPYTQPLETMNDVWSSADGVTWVQEKPQTFLDKATFDYANDWAGRHFAGYVTYANKMWIVGGDPNQGTYQTDVWSSTNGQTWMRESLGPTFGQRALHMTAVFNDKLYVMGGMTLGLGSDPVGTVPHPLDDVWTSLDGANWSMVPSTKRFTPRGIIGNQVVFGGKIWLVSGGRYDSEHPEREGLDDAWSSSDGVNWTQEYAFAPFFARIYHSVAVYDGRIWVLGGYNQMGNLNDVWYSDDGHNWYSATNPAVPERHAATVWVKDGALYWGTGNAFANDPQGNGQWVADIWKITPTPVP